MQNPYKKILEDSLESFKQSVLSEIASEKFDWFFFSKLLIEEGSPLQALLDIKVVRLAEMLDKSKSLELAASEFFREELPPADSQNDGDGDTQMINNNNDEE